MMCSCEKDERMRTSFSTWAPTRGGFGFIPSGIGIGIGIGFGSQALGLRTFERSSRVISCTITCLLTTM